VETCLGKGAREIIGPLVGRILSKLKTEKVSYHHKAND